VAALCLHGRLPAGRSGSAAPWARRSRCDVPRPLTRTVGFRCFSGPVIILEGLLPYSVQSAERSSPLPNTARIFHNHGEMM
jgi:hypothetical protein